MGKNPLKRKLTKRDFMNAVFVDFEGAKTGTNTEPDYSDPNCRKFVGMMWMTNCVNLHQFILEPSLKLCATIYDNAEESLCEEHRVRWFSTRENAERAFIKELLKRECRLIVSWSSHDWKIMDMMMKDGDFTKDEYSEIEGRWVDGKHSAKVWNREKLSRKVTSKHRLKDYCDLIGYDMPDGKDISKNLTYLSKVLEKKQHFDELTKTQIKKFKHICEYNFYDLEGMRAVLHKTVSKD